MKFCIKNRKTIRKLSTKQISFLKNIIQKTCKNKKNFVTLEVRLWIQFLRKLKHLHYGILSEMGKRPERRGQICKSILARFWWQRLLLHSCTCCMGGEVGVEWCIQFTSHRHHHRHTTVHFSGSLVACPWCAGIDLVAHVGVLDWNSGCFRNGCQAYH